MNTEPKRDVSFYFLLFYSIVATLFAGYLQFTKGNIHRIPSYYLTKEAAEIKIEFEYDGDKKDCFVVKNFIREQAILHTYANDSVFFKYELAKKVFDKFDCVSSVAVYPIEKN
jgi:hypothetical protein